MVVRVAYSDVNYKDALAATGKGRILRRPSCIGGAKRIPAMPEVPTFAEAGLPGAQSSNWWGILAPAGASGPVLARLRQEIATILESAETRKRFEFEGAEVLRMSPPEFAALIAAETDKWTRVVKEAGLKAE